MKKISFCFLLKGYFEVVSLSFKGVKMLFFYFLEIFEWQTWIHFLINLWKLFKTKLNPSNYVRKWFWSYLEVKTECSEDPKIIFFAILSIFDEVKIIFWESSVDPLKWFEFEVCYRRHFIKRVWADLRLKANVLGVWKCPFFTFLQRF